ncbi:MAG: hypothetical protein WAL66_03970, partial [Nitrososphaeraceae archaeon]
QAVSLSAVVDGLVIGYDIRISAHSCSFRLSSEFCSILLEPTDNQKEFQALYYYILFYFVLMIFFDSFIESFSPSNALALALVLAFSYSSLSVIT